MRTASGTLCSVTNNELATDAVEPEGLSRRDQAVARSLDSARLRAESRVQRFLDAATELFDSRPGRDFTVQEVVERSGQSLHSFYQYFGGKHELLLALFEETVNSTTEQLRVEIAEENDPLERLHRFVVEYYRMCRPPDEGEAGSKRQGPLGMAEFAQQLLTDHPKEAARVFSPLLSLLEEVIQEADRRRCRTSRAPPRPDRGHRARGDHVQHLLLDHRGPVTPRQRRGLGRGPVGSDPARDRVGPDDLTRDRAPIGVNGRLRRSSCR